MANKLPLEKLNTEVSLSKADVGKILAWYLKNFHGKSMTNHVVYNDGSVRIMCVEDALPVEFKTNDTKPAEQTITIDRKVPVIDIE